MSALLIGSMILFAASAFIGFKFAYFLINNAHDRYLEWKTLRREKSLERVRMRGMLVSLTLLIAAIVLYFLLSLVVLYIAIGYSKELLANTKQVDSQQLEQLDKRQVEETAQKLQQLPKLELKQKFGDKLNERISANQKDK